MSYMCFVLLFQVAFFLIEHVLGCCVPQTIFHTPGIVEFDSFWLVFFYVSVKEWEFGVSCPIIFFHVSLPNDNLLALFLFTFFLEYLWSSITHIVYVS